MAVTAPASEPPSATLSRLGLTLTDQAIVSATSFLTSLIIGRFCGKEELGLYGLALAMLLIANEVQTALVSTPHMVNTPRLAGERLRRFHGSTLLHQFGLALAFTAVLLLIAAGCWWFGKPRLALTLAALAIGITATSLGLHARAVCFTDNRPGGALAVDSVSCGLQLGVLLLLAHVGWLNAATGVLAICLTTLPPAIGWLIGALPRMAPALPTAVDDFRWIWPQARLIFVSGLLWTAGMHLYPWLIDVSAGHAAVGVWSACFTVAALGNPLMLGVMNMIGPGIARQYTLRSPDGFRRYVWLVTAAFVGGMLLFACPLAVFGGELLRLLYGQAYAGNGLVVGLLAFGLVARAAGYAVSRGLFVLHRADLDLLTNAAPLAVLLVLGVALTWTHGAVGAAWSLLVAQVAGTVVRAAMFDRCSRRASRGGASVETPDRVAEATPA